MRTTYKTILKLYEHKKCTFIYFFKTLY